MAGHSKWANIRHKKGREDSKRGKAFTKLIKEITVVARLGGGDPDSNPHLRQLVDKAKEINMPKENIERAIKKGTGELPGVNYESISYEGYGPNGIAILVETLTDNKNRTVASLRHLFSAKGGNLGESGSVSWMFEHRGVIRATDTSHSEDDLLEKLIDFDIIDICKEENLLTIECTIKSLDAVKKALESFGIKVESANLEWVPKNNTTLPENQAQKAYDFLSELDDHEDVQNVYTNLS
ncbi:YebC/PmpR family DNA-binding transcriptional regulator [bacterium]|nr:YebC/PmpR family DNA-binding transcriptional regulator [bacterium]